MHAYRYRYMYTGCNDCSISIYILRNSQECSGALTFQSVYYADVKPFVRAIKREKCAITPLQRTKALHGYAISVYYCLTFLKIIILYFFYENAIVVATTTYKVNKKKTQIHERNGM